MSKALNKEEARKVLLLVGLRCAGCAAKIEKEVGSLPGVKSASVNFATKKLTLEVHSRHDLNDIIEKTAKIAQRIESGVKVVPEEKCGQPDEPEELGKSRFFRIGIGAVVFLLVLIVKLPLWAEFGVCFAGFLIVGGDILLRAARNIVRGQVFDENFLMSIATLGAFAIGEFPEGMAVMLFYQVGELFQDAAVSRSRKSIAALMDIRPDYANLITDGEIMKVSPEDVGIGALILVKPGEKVPLDGKVAEGSSTLDTSALTGESLPREILPGDEILSGSINLNGVLTVEVTKAYGESTVSRILELVQNAAGKKAPTENFITKFARYYTPAVVLAAAVLAVIPPLLIPGATFAGWINRALVFLVVSCPCALVISIPLSFFGGIGGASRNGILIKGSNYLEALNNVDTVVFDKTGTLTKGNFAVTRIAAEGCTSEADLLGYAAYAESYSNHPIALSILKAYGEVPDKHEITDIEELSGYGIKVTVKGRRVLAGNAKLMARESIAFSEAAEVGTIVYIAVDGQYEGHIVISDALKADSKNTIQALKQLGVRKLVMLTGDNKAAGEAIGRTLGLDEVYSELLPDQKVKELEKLEAQKPKGGRLLFVGDGINDAPVLARADVGVAMGGLGSDAAIEASDIVLMTDEPSKLVTAVKTARRTRRIVWQNIIFALAVKAAVLALGAGGIATIWEAVFADVGVAVLAVLNSIRAMNVGRHDAPDV